MFKFYYIVMSNIIKNIVFIVEKIFQHVIYTKGIFVMYFNQFDSLFKYTLENE